MRLKLEIWYYKYINTADYITVPFNWRFARRHVTEKSD